MRENSRRQESARPRRMSASPDSRAARNSTATKSKPPSTIFSSAQPGAESSRRAVSRRQSRSARRSPKSRPGESESSISAWITGCGGTLKARLAVQDALQDDNEAVDFLPAPHRMKVALVTREPMDEKAANEYYLARVLRSDTGVEGGFLRVRRLPENRAGQERAEVAIRSRDLRQLDAARRRTAALPRAVRQRRRRPKFPSP